MLLKICNFITRYFPFIIVLLSIVAYFTPHQAIYLVGGVNYYIHGQNLKWTAQYLRATPNAGSSLKPSSEVTVQLQFFYF